METLADMLRLMLVPGVGAVRLARLLEVFGSAAAVLEAGFKELSRVKGISEPAIQALARKHWDEREVEFERGTFALLALYVDESVMIFHHAVDDRQAEAGPASFALFLLGEERFKNACQRTFVDACTRVGDAHYGVMPGGNHFITGAGILQEQFRGGNLHLPPAGDGFKSVSNDVCDASDDVCL